MKSEILALSTPQIIMKRFIATRRFKTIATCIAILALFAAGSAFSGCSVPPEKMEILSLEGLITVRGNVPFNAPILETDSRNFYVLKLTTEQQRMLITPERYRVIGRLYLDDWNGKPFAHLEVSEIVRLNR